MKQHDTHTISERIAALDGVDAGLVRELQMLEKTATGQIVHGAANGRHPKTWSLERWLLVCGFAGTIGYQVFGFGEVFAGIKRDLQNVAETIRDVRGNLDAHIRRHELEHEEIRRVLPPPRLSSSRPSAFPASDGLRLGNGTER